MRRTVARSHNAYRDCGQKCEDPTPSFLGGLLSGGHGKLSNPSHIKARQELAFLSGLLTPVQRSHTSVPNLIIRLFCADFNKGVHTSNARLVRTKLRSMAVTAKVFSVSSAIPA